MNRSLLITLSSSVMLLLNLVSFSEETEDTTHSAKFVLVDTAHTTNNTVTTLAYRSKAGDFLFSGGDGGFVDVFNIGSDGSLDYVEKLELYDSKGPSRGFIASRIGDKDFLFIGNKRGNAIEVFEIKPDRSFERVYIEHDSEKTHLGIVITLIVVHMSEESYLFAGGLEKTPGLSSFRILADGSLEHVQSIKDDDEVFTDGIIGMYAHHVDGNTYLVTGGFQDNGVSSFKVEESGHFKNVDNYGDNETDRYLTGTYPLDGTTLGNEHYVIVGHRHHKYYKRVDFIKKKNFVYHGDGVSVFKIDAKGKLVPKHILKDTHDTLLRGQTRIEILRKNRNEAIVAIGTRDDNSIQLCSMNSNGVLVPIGNLNTQYPIYLGMASLKIGEDFYFFAGSVDQHLKTMHSYRVEI